MRLLCLIVVATVLLTAAEGQAQSPEPSSPSPASTPAAEIGSSPTLPVSLDRIRDGLSRPDHPSLLKTAALPSDFRIQIVDQRKIDEMLSKLDFSGGPAPAGGLYGYEQQQRLFRPSSRPLMQPYAAFNGGQLATIALQNLIASYLAGPILKGVAGAMRERAAREAREEVEAAIAAYCSARPDRADIQLCNQDIP